MLYDHSFVGQNLCIKVVLDFFLLWRWISFILILMVDIGLKFYARSPPTQGVTLTDLEFLYKSHIFALKFIYAQNVFVLDGV